MPGCKIQRAQNFDSKNVGVVRGGTSEFPITNVRWIGGDFVGTLNEGEYPPGHVFHVAGNDLWFENITIDGFGVENTATDKNRGGIAMALWGNRIRVINPTIRNPYPANGAGIRVFGGTNFRCYGGSVDAGGDGALQFSGDGITPGPTRSSTAPSSAHAAPRTTAG